MEPNKHKRENEKKQTEKKQVEGTFDAIIIQKRCQLSNKDKN